MSDTYFCADTGKPYEADWTPECECPDCLPENKSSSAAIVSQFRRLWAEYQAALAQPFARDRAEDEAIGAEVKRCFENLNNLAKEG